MSSGGFEEGGGGEVCGEGIFCVFKIVANRECVHEKTKQKCYFGEQIAKKV